MRSIEYLARTQCISNTILRRSRKKTWKRRASDAIDIYGTSALFTAWVMFTMTFMLAYSSPDKQCLVDIDSVGEAEFEYWMVIVFGLPAGMVVMHRHVQAMMERWK